MSAAFARLHPKIQEAVWNQRWDELRQLQVDAIDAVLDSEDHVILAAATASGKTEAAFLPILSQLAAKPADSVQALYISPLKALINDQFRRLEDLCAYAEIPVHRWHGDVSATDKQRLRKSPGGVLLITPESLESQFINHDRHLRHIYADLRFVVIDELHAFLDSVRGIHLRSLLARLSIAAGVTPRRLGLSATIGNFAPAQAFLCVDSPCAVRILADSSQRKELRVGVKAYVEAPGAGESSERDTTCRPRLRVSPRSLRTSRNAFGQSPISFFAIAADRRSCSPISSVAFLNTSIGRATHSCFITGPSVANCAKRPSAS
jgi:ATP-dependent helicase Lhr and Lhr-like helicase